MKFIDAKYHFTFALRTVSEIAYIAYGEKKQWLWVLHIIIKVHFVKQISIKQMKVELKKWRCLCEVYYGSPPSFEDSWKKAILPQCITEVYRSWSQKCLESTKGYLQKLWWSFFPLSQLLNYNKPTFSFIKTI